MDTKEKETEKVSTPEASENLKGEILKDMSEPKVESKSEPKSNTPEISELEKLKKDLIAQADAQSKLQKKLNESEKVIDAFKSAFMGEENAETDVVTAETVKIQLDSLKQEIAKRDAEIAKNSLIDSLEVAEPVKRYLKTRVSTSSEDIEEVIKKELDSVQQLLESAVPKTTDSRPKGLGAGKGDATNMQYVLDHPELFKK
jgi:hypothetical protein